MPRSATDRSAAAVLFAAVSGGVRLHVRLAPGAARERIGGIQTGADGRPMLKVAVTAAPEAGRANAALIRLLAREWRLPKSSFAITAGAADRRKVLRIAGEPALLIDRLAAWSAEHNRTRGGDR